jgi:lysophospholipase L1-like esterase
MRLRTTSLIAVAAVLVTSIVGAGAANAAITSGFTMPASGTVHFTYAGDSLMSRGGNWLGRLGDPALVNDGGSAISANTTAQIAAIATPHPNSDVLVIGLGTNDVNYGTPAATINRDMERLVAKVGAKHVLVLALPPSRITKDKTTKKDRQLAQYYENWHLEAFAEDHGWDFADPYVKLRYYSNQKDYNRVYTDDGIHPNAAGVALVVPVARNLIREAALGGSR